MITVIWWFIFKKRCRYFLFTILSSTHRISRFKKSINIQMKTFKWPKLLN